MMTSSKWYEQMVEEILHDSDRDEESSLCRTVTATGDVRTSLDGGSVYSVRRNGKCF